MAVEAPSVGRYLLGCLIMLVTVVVPLGVMFVRTQKHGRTRKEDERSNI